MGINLKTDSHWFIRSKDRQGLDTAMRLICIPYAGGNAAVYQQWQQHLPSEVEVIAVQLPGRGHRLLESPINDLDQITDAILTEMEPYLDKPFALFGHSMGAMISYELASKLQESRIGELRHLFVSAFRAVHLPRVNHYRYLLPDQELIEELRKLNGTPEMLLQNEELMELFLPVIRADLQLCDTYTYRQRDPLQCGLTAFAGEQDRGVELTDIRAWSELVSGSFEFCSFPGDHFFIHSDERLLLRKIAEQLNSLLAVV